MRVGVPRSGRRSRGRGRQRGRIRSRRRRVGLRSGRGDRGRSGGGRRGSRGRLVKRLRLAREHREQHRILVGHRQAPGGEFLTQLSHAGGQEVGGPTLDGILFRLLAGEGEHLRIDRARCAAVLAQRDVDAGLGEVLPAAELHIEHRLRADDLRGGRDQRDPAQRFAHHRHLGHHVVEPRLQLQLGKLRAEVAQHPARHLVTEGVAVDAIVGRAHELRQLRGHALEVLAQFQQDLGVVFRRARMIGHRGEHADGVGLAGAIREGRDGGVDDIGTRVDRREVARHRHAGGVVAVHDHRLRVPLLDRLHQLVGHARGQQTRHVLDADRVGAEFDQFVGQRRQLGRRVHGAGGVADRPLRMFAHRLHGADRRAKVARVVERIEDAKLVHPVVRGAAHEGLDDVIGKARVLDDVLPPQQHHVRSPRRGRLELIEPVEGVFLQETQGRVDRRSAPGFQRAKAKPVEAGGGREHLGGGHARRRQGLVAVAQDGVVEDDRLHAKGSEG